MLGGDYVGGIAGALSGSVSKSIQAESVSVTTNASYVIGNSYVGGIVGENRGDSTISNCVNTGVAAGYGSYIGGIAGANASTGTATPVIRNCASYISDTNSSIYRMVLGWNAVGSHAGGLAGYNSGKIEFTDADNPITTRSVSGIVVGKDYVGGLVGFNDVTGDIDVAYTLIGGRVYATGDCVGGLVGLNASAHLLTEQLTVQPSSVQGRYYVGGAIGANIVNLMQDTTMDGIIVKNSLGTVTGEAFCGGLIGYHRTFAQGQAEVSSILSDMENRRAQLLPDVNTSYGNTPAAVAQSGNPYVLTITNPDNNAASLSTASNNMSIRAYAYAGGIVGFCEAESRLVLKDCLNQGSFAQPAADAYPNGSAMQNGVNVEYYLRTQSYTDAAEALARELNGGALNVAIIGGVIGVNGEKHVIDHCGNTGAMNGLSALGGVVGLNEGFVTNCALSGNMGSATQDFVGGIVGLNIGGRNANQTTAGYTFVPGTVSGCETNASRTVTGRSTVGGVVGYNMYGGTVKDNVSNANVTGADAVGGVVGQNAGTITLSGPAGDKTRRVTGTGTGVGGVIGVNTAEGTLRASGAAADTDIIVADSALTVTGGAKVGGVAGINRGTLTADGSAYLTSCAALVRAANGYAGGVLGAQEGTNTTLSRAKNLGRQVTANAGAAGGVVGYNGAGNTVRDCVDGGSVASSNGYAGGVVSENAGTIENCTVAREGETGSDVTIRTVGVDASGAICAVNRAGAVIRASVPGEGVVISGSATVLGAIAGDNYGTITGAKVTVQPKYDVSGSELTVGGAAGRNSAGGTISGVEVRSDFEQFSRYRYLGGVVGENCAEGTDEETQTALAEALVTNCLYAGKMTESRSAAGNCYGGVAGLNRGRLEGSTVSELELTAVGVYTATSTSTAEQKEEHSSHIGGIAGKNEETGTIEKCYIDDEDGGDSSIDVKNGMVGGVTGYNKGTITQSGDKSTENLMLDVSEVSDLLANAKDEQLSADSKWVQWDTNNKVESMSYSGGKSVANARTMQIIVSSNGNLGGVAGYNAPTGALDRCASGNWLLVNKSDSISVGTGGIIGMNESEKDLSFLLNRAFVGRQLDTADTNRFAGGIIGTQSNTTTSSWTIRGCVNYGTVYVYNTHYAGGIVGQWTNNGGTIEGCYNYGNLQTTIAYGWVGAAGGIVAQLYHGASGQDFNIISCRNDGSIYGRTGESQSNSANDSAGILGNVTNYIAWNAGKGDGEAFNINVVDCVNGPGVKIYATSMASGIVGFFSVDDSEHQSSKIGQSTENIVLNIDRCRNYASWLQANNFRAGIFGDRYWDLSNKQVAVNNTYLQNCFSVAYDTTTNQAKMQGYEVVSFGNAQGYAITPSADKVCNNYYFNAIRNLTNGSGTNGWTESNWEARRGGSRMLLFGKLPGSDGVFAARVGPEWYDVHASGANHTYYGGMGANNASIDENGNIIGHYSGEKTLAGHVLFTLPDTAVYNGITNGSYTAASFQNALKEKNGAMNDMDEYVRTYYKEFEHGKTAEGDKLDRSFAVNLSQEENGSFDVAITDNDRPLYYEGEVYIEGQSEPVLKNLRFIPNQKGQGLWSGTFTGSGAGYGSGTTTGTFQLPDELAKETAGKTIVLRVRAVSLFEETEASDWVESEQKNVAVLPTPDVNIRLASIRNNSGWYDVTLNNLADFEAFNNWQVEIRLDSKRVVINAANPIVEIEGDELQEMHVTATADPTADGIQPQAVTVSIPTDTPKYKPDASIDQLTATVSGTTIDDLVISADLTIRQSSGVTTPPIYRIELVGTVNGEDIVFDYEDVLVSVGNAVTANFRDIPAQFFGADVTNRHLRAWYAASGLGPVYTYGSTPLRNGGDVAETVRTYKDGGSYDEETVYSFVLNDSYTWAFGNWTNGAYKRVRSLSELRALPAPELAAPPLGRELVGGELRYTFRWDQDKTYTDAHYTVSLTGITAEGGEVGIPTEDVYTNDTAKSFTITADDWRYRQVRLTVTRVGQTQNEIGLSSTTVYDVKQRLERPGQPVVENPDTNELKYTVSWPPISSETGCAGYRVYIQPENGAEQTLSELVPAGQSSYSVICDLEPYAGQNVTIYLVAVAQTDSEYENSPNGVSYSMTVPERIGTPSITYSYNWNSATNNPIAADRFRSGGLVVTVHPNNAASNPPGGSTYLLCAEITAPDGSTVSYPTTGQVAAMSASGGDYILNLTDLDTKYAGCAVRFYARISNTSGQVSSDWVASGLERLPRVKLAQPSSTVEHTDLPMTVNISNLPGMQGNAQQWSARRTTISWPAVENADVYQLALTDGGETTDIRILQTANGVTVQRRNGAAWETVTANAEGWFTLREGDSVTGRYAPSGSTGQYYYTYRLDTLLRADANGFTLCLPNVSTLTTQDGQSINGGAVSTTEVSITSNVQANLAGTSAYYAASDARTHTFN